MTINDITNNIYVINLKHRIDRRVHIINELNKVNIDKYNLIEAVNGNDVINNTGLKNGMYGLCLTYLNIYNMWVKQNESDILIIEDDCIFDEDFNSKLELYMSNVPNDWDMLYFGGNHNYHIGCQTIKINDYWKKLTSTYSAHCVLLKNYVFNELISKLQDMTIENDVLLSKLQKKYNAYSTTEPIATQMPSYSDIENIYVNYKWLIC